MAEGLKILIGQAGDQIQMLMDVSGETDLPGDPGQSGQVLFAVYGGKRFFIGGLDADLELDEARAQVERSAISSSFSRSAVISKWKRVT